MKTANVLPGEIEAAQHGWEALRSYHFRMADIGTGLFLLACEGIARVAFDSHLSIWFALGYLASSAVMNHCTFKGRVANSVASRLRKS
jgi:hypothetical protein